MKIRASLSADIVALQHIADATELFPGDMLPDMIAGFLSGGDDLWLTCIVDDVPAGFCYAVPEMLAEGAWNMLAIAVAPDVQGKGAGQAICAALEDMLRQRDARIVIADTSGTDEYAQTRDFYRKAGYHEEARIRYFWAAGDDKIVFWKALG